MSIFNQKFQTEPSTSIFATKPKEEPPPVNPLLEQAKQIVDELTEETISASCKWDFWKIVYFKIILIVYYSLEMFLKIFGFLEFRV